MHRTDPLYRPTLLIIVGVSLVVTALATYYDLDPLLWLLDQR